MQKLRIENVMSLTNTRAGRGSKQETEDLAWLLSLAEHRMDHILDLERSGLRDLI